MAFKKGNKCAVGHKGVAPNIIWTREKIDLEAVKLVEWAKKPESLVLGECYGERGYSYEEATEFAKRNDNYKRARFMARTLIGARREKGGLKNKFDAGLVGKTMMLYDPDFKAWLKENKREQILEDMAAEQAAKEISKHLKNQPIVTDVGQAAEKHF